MIEDEQGTLRAGRQECEPEAKNSGGMKPAEDAKHTDRANTAEAAKPDLELNGKGDDAPAGVARKKRQTQASEKTFRVKPKPRKRQIRVKPSGCWCGGVAQSQCLSGDGTLLRRV